MKTAEQVLKEILVKYIEADKMSSKHREEAVLEAMEVFAEQFICNQEEQMKFAEWIYDQMYVKYFGSDGENVNKWYKSYTKPDRKYYTFPELFNIYKSEAK